MSLIRVMKASAHKYHFSLYVAPDVAGDEPVHLRPEDTLTIAPWRRALPGRYELRKVKDGVYALGLRGSTELDDIAESLDNLPVCRFPVDGNRPRMEILLSQPADLNLLRAKFPTLTFETHPVLCGFYAQGEARVLRRLSQMYNHRK